MEAREIKLAESLMGHLASKWEPERYTDEYQRNLMRVIKAKLKGKAPKLAEPEEPRSAEVIDLMTRLRQSLGQSPKSRCAKTARKRKGASRKRQTTTHTRKRGRHAA